MLGGEGGNTPRVQGFTREVTGKETGGNELAPAVANSCGGRGKFLWRTCECLAAAAKRLSLLAFGVGRMDDATAFSKCKDTKKKAKMQEKSLFILHFARFFVP